MTSYTSPRGRAELRQNCLTLGRLQNADGFTPTWRWNPRTGTVRERSGACSWDLPLPDRRTSGSIPQLALRTLRTLSGGLRVIDHPFGWRRVTPRHEDQVGRRVAGAPCRCGTMSRDQTSRKRTHGQEGSAPQGPQEVEVESRPSSELLTGRKHVEGPCR